MQFLVDQMANKKNDNFAITCISLMMIIVHHAINFEGYSKMENKDVTSVTDLSFETLIEQINWLQKEMEQDNDDEDVQICMVDRLFEKRESVVQYPVKDVKRFLFLAKKFVRVSVKEDDANFPEYIKQKIQKWT